jgi:hypothetical protein
MADLKRLEFPDELRHHSLSEQELSPLSPAQQALAKDWNVIKRQTEWTMNKVIDIHNLMVDHDRELETVKFWIKLVSFGFGGGGSIIGFLYFISTKFGGH